MRIYENIAQICAEEGRSVASVEKKAHFALGTIRRWVAEAEYTAE